LPRYDTLRSCDTIDRTMLPIAGQSGEPGRTGPSWTAGAPELLRDNYNLELAAEDTGLDPILDYLAKTRPDDTAPQPGAGRQAPTRKAVTSLAKRLSVTVPP
jgi:hypothetical protein